MTLTYEAMVKAAVRALTNTRGQDPITQAEKVVEYLQVLIETSDSGFAVPPISIVREDPIPEETWRGEPRRTNEPPALPPQAGLLVTPGAKEFEEAKRIAGLEEKDLRTGRTAKPRTNLAPIALTKVGAPGVGKQVKAWEFHTLIQELERHTPDKFHFRPKGTAEGTNVLAVRNIVTQQGMDTIRLQYANPQMGEDSIQPGDSYGGGKCTIALIASHTFSLFDAEIDIEAAMDSIQVQLEGMYRPRGGSMAGDPGPDPGPLNFNMQSDPMGDSETTHTQPGWRVRDNLGEVRSRVIRANESVGTPGHRG